VIKIFTIGFTQKSAEQFFTLLVKNGVSKLIDVRLNNSSQLAGFASSKHLPYCLKLHNIEYQYSPQFAPTKELLKGYRDKKIDWSEYEKRYIDTLQKRKILDKISIEEFDNSVLLCSEPTADKCHRRLLAEYLANHFPNIEIGHL